MKRSLKNDKMKTYAEINEKIKKGTAVVLTAEEVSELSKTLSPKEIAEKVDVVTTATFGAMCSSGAFLNFGHSNPPIRMEKIELNGVLWGVVNLNSVQLPEYGAIPWTIPAAAEEVGVIHTLCIRPSCSGRGYARQMVAFCEAEARRQGRTVIRLDTWEGNLPANRLYPSLGYRYAGTAEFFFMGFVRENLNCYEKAL